MVQAHPTTTVPIQGTVDCHLEETAFPGRGTRAVVWTEKTRRLADGATNLDDNRDADDA